MNKKELLDFKKWIDNGEGYDPSWPEELIVERYVLTKSKNVFNDRGFLYCPWCGGHLAADRHQTWCSLHAQNTDAHNDYIAELCGT